MPRWQHRGLIPATVDKALTVQRTMTTTKRFFDALGVATTALAALLIGAAAQAQSSSPAPLPTVRLSAHTRIENLPDTTLPVLNNAAIEAFLVEPLVVEQNELDAAPRIVATQEGRVLLSRGDRAYARGPAGAALIDDPARPQKIYRIFRTATPLLDPLTGAVLGYEAQYVGKASLVRGESGPGTADATSAASPATIDIVAAKEEIRVGDRLLPEPPQSMLNYAPHTPATQVDARIVSVYGSAVANAAQNQVVSLNRGSLDGLENGQVLAILKDGERLVDKTDAARSDMKLPNERNGLLMVFRTFPRVAYALVLNITDAARIGDRLVNPR